MLKISVKYYQFYIIQMIGDKSDRFLKIIFLISISERFRTKYLLPQTYVKMFAY